MEKIQKVRWRKLNCARFYLGLQLCNVSLEKVIYIFLPIRHIVNV